MLSAVLAIINPSVRPSVRLSVTRWHCVKTTPATIIRSSLADSLMTRSSFLTVNFSTKFQREHRERQLYQTKFTSYWSTTINDCRDNPRMLWRTVNAIMKAPTQQTSAKFTANDFADFFQSKVSHIRHSTATYPPPVIQPHPCSPLVSFDPVTESEVQRILATCHTASSVVDPIPSWLLKQLWHLFIPVICHLCNLSLQSGIFPSSHSRAVVLPRLKKPTLDPDSLS